MIALAVLFLSYLHRDDPNSLFATLLLTHGNTVAVNSGFLQKLALDGIGPVRWFWLLALVAALIVAGLIFRTRIGDQQRHLLGRGDEDLRRLFAMTCTHSGCG